MKHIKFMIAGGCKLSSSDIINQYIYGVSLKGHEIFGAKPQKSGKYDGVRFTVYAPNAATVEVIGDFNEWKGTKMNFEIALGVWSVFIPHAQEGDLYKYRIYDRFGHSIIHTDPFGYFSELRPDNASQVCDISGYKWHDKNYIDIRTKNFDKPLNIYEIHLGSWKLKKNSTTENSWYTYTQLKDELIPYVKKNGYTHIEIMPLSEHPLDESWGYQTSGYFSVTSRYGTPKQLMEFIDACHVENIGVIMDFVPAHFISDDYALSMFDGTSLYESENNENSYTQWGTIYFDLTKGHVASFLMSALDFWLTNYHFDGVRFDAVSNLIYLHGVKENGINYPGIWFMQKCNYLLTQQHPGVMLIAEDSSDYPKVTAPVIYGGLGFDYKWDLGWMNDTLEYVRKQPCERPDFHNRFTFSMSYFCYENFLLPFSHDEVVHGKKSIIDKIYGTYEEKFSTARTLYLYMMTHPGKKLNFMGNELAVFREWDEKREIDWELLKYPMHDSFNKYLIELNKIYLSSEVLYKKDYDLNCGFCWIDADNSKQCVFSYMRSDANNNIMVVVLNFSDNDYTNFSLKVPHGGTYKEVINTDYLAYSGLGRVNEIPIQARLNGCNPKFPYAINVHLAPLTGAVFVVC